MTAGRTEKPRAPEGWHAPRKPAHGVGDTASEERAAPDGAPSRSGGEATRVSGKWEAPRKTWREDRQDGVGSDGVIRGGTRTGASGSEERPAKRSDIAEGDLERKGKEPPSVAGHASATSGSASPRTGADTDVSAKALQRKKIGLGSYEDPADEKRRKGKPKKTGRPGR